MTQQMYLVCANKHIFPSGLGLKGEVRKLSLQHNFTQCPYCGLDTPWPNGTYDFVGGVFIELGRSSDPIKTAKELLEELKKSKEDDKKPTPKLNGFFPGISAETKRWVVTILIMLLQLYVQMSENSNTEVNQQNIIHEYNINVTNIHVEND